MVICHLALQAFGLCGPDRSAENTRKLAILLDQAGNQCLRSHTSLWDNEQPYASLIELFNSNTEFVDEVCAALCTSGLCIVWSRRST